MNEADHNLPQIILVLQEIGQTLFLEIRQLIESAKQRAAIAINAEITMLYWQVSHPSRNTPRSTRRIWQTNYCYPIPTTHPNLWQRLERSPTTLLRPHRRSISRSRHSVYTVCKMSPNTLPY